MKILVVMPLAEKLGGSEAALIELLKYTRNGAVSWHIVFLQDGPMLQEAQALGAEVTLVHAGRLRYPHTYLRSVRHIAELARSLDARLIFGWMTKAQLYGGPASIIAGIPSVWFQHGMPAAIGIMDRLATLLPARRIFTCSEAGADVQRSVFPGRQVHVVYPGADINKFSPGMLPPAEECRRELGLTPDAPIIGMVGRLQRWKGMHVLAEAMPAILADFPDTRCVIVGGTHSLEPEYPDYLNSVIKNFNVEDVVILAGHQENVATWMAAMDVIVHASDCEPFGMVIVEAMAMGKPVVAGNSGGPREIIRSEEEGLLAPFEDSALLAEQILRYMRDPVYARGVAGNARKRAREFSTAKFAERVVHEIQDVLSD